MKYRKLKSLQHKISELSLGTYPFKGWWGKPLSDEEVIKIIHKAIELGINFIDTADVYGLGQSESLLGKVKNELKDKFIISTKGGRDFTTNKDEISKNFDVNYLSKALEASLKRLSRDYVDIYFLHGPEQDEIDKGSIFEFLDKTKSRGLVRATGVSLNKSDELDSIISKYIPDIISIPYNFLSDTNISTFIDSLKKYDIDLIVREPLAQGLLTGKYTRDSKFPSDDHRSWKWTKEFWDENEERLNKFNKENQTYEEKIKGSFKHILKNSYISTVIFGAKSIKQLEDNLTITEQI